MDERMRVRAGWSGGIEKERLRGECGRNEGDRRR